ncbi:MAG: hypothetical protein D3926_03560 [Desulfobacteraceae bacterium]|nr:MAG: hypothetical protein D3926_03560 [Desulfobacteraceae bacterium]
MALENALFAIKTNQPERIINNKFFMFSPSYLQKSRATLLKAIRLSHQDPSLPNHEKNILNKRFCSDLAFNNLGTCILMTKVCQTFKMSRR